MSRRNQISLLFTLVFVTAVSAQSEIRFEEVYSINSLSHNNVTCIHQDQLGFLWLGTFNGLNKYDGYSFKIYKFSDLENDHASTNRITSIREDQSGRLWIQTYDGEYQCFNPATEKFISFPRDSDSPFQARVTDFYESPGGMVCLSTDRSGLFFITGAGLDEEAVIHHIKNTPGEEDILTSNHVSFIIQDINKYFWIGTDNGLSRIHEEDIGQADPRVLKYFMNSEGDSGNGIAFQNCVHHGDRLWFGNEENGLAWYDPGNERIESFADHPEYMHLASLKVTALESHGSKLWIGTSNGIVLKYELESGEFTEFLLSDPESGHDIESIYCDIFEQVWIVTEAFGITRFNPYAAKFKHYNLTPPYLRNLTNDERVSIYEDSKNQFWLGGQNIGVQKFNRQLDQFAVYTNDPGDPGSLQSSIVESLLEDRENNLWIGTSWFGKGLSRVITTDPAFHYIVPVASPESKIQNVVRSVYVDSKGYTWAGTKSGQIYIYDNELELKHIIEKDPRINYTGSNVYSIIEDAEGFIWLCTKGAGIFISNQSIKEVSPEYKQLTFSSIRNEPGNKNSLNNDNIYDLVIDDLNRIWVATFGGGLNLISTDDHGNRLFHQFTTENSALTSNRLRDLHLDRNGRLWLASTFGLNYIDVYNGSADQLEINHVLSNQVENRGLSYNDIIMIMEDKNGHLWLASAGGGVNQIIDPTSDTLEFAYYSEKDGLKDDYILSLTEDIYGFIWIGTASGLSRYNPFNGEINNFDKKIGLPEVFFSERTSVSSHSGKIIFGTIKGFYVISPDMISSEESHPEISLTGFQLNNTEITPGEEGSPLDRSISYLDEIILKSNQSNFSIGFSMLSFKSPESNHYSYTLEGFNEGWNYIGAENKATFTNVPSGSYNFRVKGLDSDFSEYGTETSLKITVLPPIWKSQVAIAIYIIFILALAFLAYRIALRFVRLKNNLKVEKRVAESKLRFFTNISHEIRTPLTLILGPIDNLIAQTDIRSDVRHQLTVMHRNTKRLLRMVNQILDFRKVQNEKLTLRIQEIEIIPFLNQIYESFEAQAKQKHIKFNMVYDQHDEHLTIWGDIQKLDIVIFNLLSNAFKFTPENRSISIIVSRAFEQQGVVKIQVSDSGIGIDKEKIDMVFDRFFVSHTEKNIEHQGTGIGLSLSQEYINLHNGEIKVESVPSKGTDFIVTLLTGKSHFPEDVIIQQREAYSYTPKVGDVEEVVSVEENFEADRPDSKDKPHLLVVEDDVEMCMYLEKILEVEYKVDLAKDGLDGWTRAREITPDLIITDVMMPGMNGIELTEKLKDEFTTCHIPVIMLSAKSAVENQVEGLQIGAEAYVPKPFNAELLLSYIKSLLSQRKVIRDILESKVELKPDEVKVTPKDKKFIEKVLTLIDEQLADPEFNVEQLATNMYISRTLFYKKIKGITGYQPVELIRMMRLKKAAKFIETGEFTVSEVAYMVGYNDIRYFSTSFKKQFGISPSQYQPS